MNEILTLREVAAWLHCHPMTVYRLAHQRKIPAFRVASEWRFSRRDIELWMEQVTVMGRHDPNQPGRGQHERRSGRDK